MVFLVQFAVNTDGRQAKATFLIAGKAIERHPWGIISILGGCRGTMLRTVSLIAPL